MKRFFVMILASALVLASFDASAQRDQRGNRSRFDREFNHAASGLGVTFGYAHSAYRVADWATDKVRKADAKTFELISEGVADMHCLSDEYLADELCIEYNIH